MEKKKKRKEAKKQAFKKMPKGHLRTKIIQQLKFGNPALWAQCKSEDNRGENNKLKTGQWSSESNQSAKRTQMEDARRPRNRCNSGTGSNMDVLRVTGEEKKGLK